MGGEKHDKAKRRRVRLFFDTPLVADGKMNLTAAQAHYLGNVMRLKPGDSILIFNGRDGEWRATLAILRRGGGILAVEERTRLQTNPSGPILLFAPLNTGRNAFLIEKSVELGVGALQPVTTAYGQTRRVNFARFRAQAIEAAEQCGRLTVPAIQPLVSLSHLLTDWPHERPILFCDETGGPPALAAISSMITATQGMAWAILIGPEGGFSSLERERVRSRTGTVAVSLGPRILRSETAAITALSLWQAAIGGLGGDNSGPNL